MQCLVDIYERKDRQLFRLNRDPQGVKGLKSSQWFVLKDHGLYQHHMIRQDHARMTTFLHQNTD